MQESLRATSASAGASLLAEHGVCWLDAALAPAALRGVADEAHTSFTALLTAIISRHEAECRGLPAHLHRLARMPVQCAEVVERDGGRFDCRYGCDGLPQLLLEQATLLAQLLEAVLGDELAVVAHGQVVALSEEGRAHYLSEDAAEAGASPQAWHADGPHLFCGGAPGGGAPPPKLPAYAVHACTLRVHCASTAYTACTLQLHCICSASMRTRRAAAESSSACADSLPPAGGRDGGGALHRALHSAPHGGILRSMSA